LQALRLPKRFMEKIEVAPNSSADLSFATAELPLWQQRSVRMIERAMGKTKLMHRYHAFLETNQSAETFWEDVIDCLELSLFSYKGTLDSVPAEGPLVVVANHPFGLIDGASICWLVAQKRKDFKVILWDVFDKKNNGREYFLPLDLAEDSKQARRQNLSVRRRAVSDLKDGHVIIIFPSGNAERQSSVFGKPYELPWHPFTEKIMAAGDAPVLPVFFHGHNSKLFHLSSMVSETARRALFFHELKRRIGTEVDLSIGNLIDRQQISTWRDTDQSVTQCMRDVTMALADTKLSANKTTLRSL